LAEAIDEASLPYADDQGTVEGWMGGSYVLRGSSPVEAWVLSDEETDPAPTPTLIEVETAATSAPASPELGDIGQIEGMSMDNLQWLAEELGLCEGDQQGEDESRCQEITQAYLAGAFLQSTDLRPHRAAMQLRALAELLQDTDGARTAALGRVVSEFVQVPVPPSEEQITSIATAFSEHAGDGTHYATAAQWIGALVEYIDTLDTEMGWPIEQATAFVMDKYGAPITQGDNPALVAYVKARLAALEAVE